MITKILSSNAARSEGGAILNWSSPTQRVEAIPLGSITTWMVFGVVRGHARLKLEVMGMRCMSYK